MNKLRKARYQPNLTSFASNQEKIDEPRSLLGWVYTGRNERKKWKESA